MPALGIHVVVLYWKDQFAHNTTAACHGKCCRHRKKVIPLTETS